MVCEHCVIVWLINPETCGRVQIHPQLRARPELNRLGWFDFTIDPNEVSNGYLKKCNLIHVRYKCNSSDTAREIFTGMLQERTINPQTGMETWAGYSLNVLLRNSVVAFPDSSVYASKTGAADDVMRLFVNENRGIGQSGNRPCAGAGGIIQLCDQIRRNGQVPDTWTGNRPATELLELIQGIGLAYDVDFDLTLQDDCSVCFNTYHPQKGRDRRTGTANPLLLSEKLNNLTVDSFFESCIEEAHVAVVYGADEIICVTGNDYENTPSFCRREIAVFAEDQDTIEALETIGREELAQYRRTVQIEFELEETDQFTFGTDLQIGDRFNIQYGGETFDYKLVSTPFVIDEYGFAWEPFVYELSGGAL